MYRVVLASLALSTAAYADTATVAARAFASHCFSPYLTATQAQSVLGDAGGRYDFYDLKPFSNAAPSPAYGLRPATSGTDRRCEVSFNGDHRDLAVELTLTALRAQNITKDAKLPASHSEIDGTALLAARFLNPRRIAVVHVGTRQGPDGVETFMNVERLTPSASKQ